ncbi:binding-protein-dependent transport systems inner membrane component [Thermobaculum terrenum ATCC BAA-798]|uniref:Binding-protein-dependent transport systems inner membrane component n=1 Tax=Thermobaculum terrenum (strain ATCC BAA-798 / CCMEE 7001 / YNP1) TaxID=525904 RepID=D1CHA4_THET1|nr:ABC transporter permease subunit [Thermobaculum terrenum]ACZ43125.1 binding-protein-dependent transport systems inner membrane component [Thermobaculum terrenum ATCC BAA-798]
MIRALRGRLSAFSGWAVPVVLLLVWEALGWAGVLPARILPPPSRVLLAAWKLLESGQLVNDMAVSARRALLGFALGGGLGFVLGVVNGLSSTLSRLLDSTLQMIRNIPHLALIPLVILWFGIGEQGKLFLVAEGVLFPVYVNTYHGIRNVDSGLLEMGQVYGLSRWEVFRDIVLPGALPSILVGVRYALGVMWLTLIVAETIAASSGIGYITMQAREFMQTDVLVMGILLYAALGKLADTVARLLERQMLRWHPAYQKA